MSHSLFCPVTHDEMFSLYLIFSSNIWLHHTILSFQYFLYSHLFSVKLLHFLPSYFYVYSWPIFCTCQLVLVSGEKPAFSWPLAFWYMWRHSLVLTLLGVCWNLCIFVFHQILEISNFLVFKYFSESPSKTSKHLCSTFLVLPHRFLRHSLFFNFFPLCTSSGSWSDKSYLAITKGRSLAMFSERNSYLYMSDFSSFADEIWSRNFRTWRDQIYGSSRESPGGVAWLSISQLSPAAGEKTASSSRSC